MELDDLKASWNSLDTRLERLAAINLSLITDNQRRKARWRLLPVIIGALLNIAAGGWLVSVCARFWSTHFDTPSALISGIALHLGGLGIVIAGVVQLLIVARINFAQPVIEMQRYLALLHAWEVRSFGWLWLGAWLAWPAVLVAGAMSIAGVDLWARAPEIVIVNVLVSVAAVVGFIALHRRARRGGRLGVWLDRLLTNHSIERARSALGEIDRFSRE
jgi:hypothetical protein